ncbi:MAG: TIGR04053 family radical SAM/SPASM domain-containing protein [Nitriliruptoraceae bacterium]
MTGHRRGAAVRSLRHDPSVRPFLVIWEVTRACGLVCRHCRADAQTGPHPFQLTFAQGCQLLDDIAEFGAPSPMIVLTGGDPFERDDLVDLLDHGRKAGLSIALAPSVTPRATPDRFRQIADAGAKAVSISLDGATAATHDGFRGVDGVFDATFQACRTIVQAGMRLQLNTTITASNVGELPDIFGHALDLDAFLWSVFLLVPTGRGDLLEPLSADAVEDVLHWLVDVAGHLAVKTTEAPHFRRVVLQRRRLSGCDPQETFRLGATYQQLRARLDVTAASRVLPMRIPRPPLDINAGRGFVFIDHLGTVYPSGFLPIPVGSVREHRLIDLYRNAPLLRQLRDPSALTDRCGRCEYRAICGGSRSRAYAVARDPFAEEPACLFEPSGGPLLSVAGLEN